ncbi:MAG TPA: ATP-binding cassette domain-containing protein [Thermotogota bacterium]|nr:ATP-binding cassette domain-containing protein [Thermotogota bacterium]
MPETGSTALLEVKDLRKYFPIKSGFLIQRTVAQLKAVDGVSFAIDKGRTFGIVGESGCGKTTIGRTIIRLLNQTGGHILLEGQDIATLKERPLKDYRKKMQIVFQDPTSSLNPRMTVGQTLSEPLLFHEMVHSKKEAEERMSQLLSSVGLKPYHVDRYPHQFSGGQRQRIAIARAICVDPSLIVLDEPTSALDVSVQAQIIKLLKELQGKLNAGYIFISHNLSVVRYISDQVGIMYLGKMVEKGDTNEIFDKPEHPYSKALLAATPIPDPKTRRKRKELLTGQVPSPINRPSGCFFRTRCKYAMPACEKEYPEMVRIAEHHWVACHIYSLGEPDRIVEK